MDGTNRTGVFEEWHGSTSNNSCAGASKKELTRILTSAHFYIRGGLGSRLGLQVKHGTRLVSCQDQHVIGQRSD